MIQLDSENGDYNLTATVTVLTHTPDTTNPSACRAVVLLGDGVKNLDGTGGDFELEVHVGGVMIDGGPITKTLGTQTRARIQSIDFDVPANTAVLVKVKSPNAADTDVDVTAYLYDTDPVQPSVHGRTATIDATGNSAADIKLVLASSAALANFNAQFNGTGYTDPTAPASRAQVDAIGAASGGSVNFAAIEDNTGGAIDPSSAVFVGSVQAGTYASTEAENGTLHDIDDTTDDIDIVYGFAVGGGRVATQITFVGFVQGNADEIKIKVYDHAGADWETIATIAGQVGTDNITIDRPLLLKHTGTGSELGKVYIRFETDSTTPSNLSVDRLTVAAVNMGQSVGYALGAIWVDTNNGTAGTEDFVNGVGDNPCLTWADAVTISASRGIKRFAIANNSAITLSGVSDSFTLFGEGWSLNLNGKSIEGACFRGAISVTGTGLATTTQPHFIDCQIGTATIPPSKLTACGLGLSSGILTAGSAGQYLFEKCYSVVPGQGAPEFVFTGLGSATGINNRGMLGGSDYTLDSNCTLSHEVLAGGGTTIVTGGADVEIRGVTRSLDITLAASETVQFVGITGDITISGTAVAAAVNLYGTSSSISDSSTGSTVNDYTTSSENVWSASQRTLTHATNITSAGTPISSDGSDFTNLPWNADWDAQVESEVTDALNAYNPPTYDNLLGFFQVALRSDAAIITDRAADLAAINADEGSGIGNYSAATDSQEGGVDTLSATISAAVATLSVEHATTDTAIAILDGKIDLVTGYVDSLETRLTAARAGYLDNLNVGGPVASQADVSVITNSVRNKLVLPTEFQIPTADDVRFVIDVFIYSNDDLVMEDPDADTVNLHVSTYDGTSRDANLRVDSNPLSMISGTVMNKVAVGHYRLWYLVATSHAQEQLRFDIDYAEAGNTIKGSGNCMIVTNPVGTGFIATDRTKLEAIFDKLPSRLYLTGSTDSSGNLIEADLPSLDVAVSTRSDFDETADFVRVSGTIQDLDTLDAAQDAQHAATQAAVALIDSMSSFIKDALGNWTGTGNNHLLGAIRAMVRSDADASYPDDINADLGGGAGTADNTTHSLQGLGNSSAPTVEEIDAELSANHGAGSWEQVTAGGGARTITPTVDDGTNPIEGAKIRYTKGIESYVSTTDVNGQAVFNLDDGTWTVAISAPGYSFSGTTEAVSGDATPTYSMTQITISASEPGQTTGFLTAYNKDGLPEQNATFLIAVHTEASDVDGIAYDDEWRTALSDADGLVQFTNLFKGARYKMKRGTANKEFIFTVPSDAGESYELPSLVGHS